MLIEMEGYQRIPTRSTDTGYFMPVEEAEGCGFPQYFETILQSCGTWALVQASSYECALECCGVGLRIESLSREGNFSKILNAGSRAVPAGR
jgi:hypothetical protein